MANKLIKDIDEETWRGFVAFCKLKNSKVHEELEQLIKNHTDKHLPAMFKKCKMSKKREQK